LYNDALYLIYVEQHSDVKEITTGRQVELLGYDVVDIRVGTEVSNWEIRRNPT